MEAKGTRRRVTSRKLTYRPYALLPGVVVLLLAVITALSAAPALAGGAFTMTAACQATAARLPAPEGVGAVRYGRYYLVSWKAVESPEVAGYNVYRSYLPYPLLSSMVKVNPRPVRGTSFLDTTLTDYWRIQYYWVAAVDCGNRLGALGGPATVNPLLPDCTPPEPPRNLEAGALEVGVSLTWEASNREPDFAGYHVYLEDECGRPARLTCQPVKGGFFYSTRGGAGSFFQVRSVDTSGNLSSPVRAQAVTLPEEVLDFPDPAANQDERVVYKGLWVNEHYRPEEGLDLLEGDMVTSVYPLDGGECDPPSVKVTFQGRSVKLVAARFWQCGWCEIFLDGRSVGRINLSSDEPLSRCTLYATYCLPPGTHTLKVVNLGIPGNPEMPFDVVNVDYLVIR